MIEVFLIILCLLCLDGNFRYITHFKFVYFVVYWFTQVVILHFLGLYDKQVKKNAKFPMVSLYFKMGNFSIIFLKNCKVVCGELFPKESLYFSDVK